MGKELTRAVTTVITLVVFFKFFEFIQAFQNCIHRCICSFFKLATGRRVP